MGVKRKRTIGNVGEKSSSEAEQLSPGGQSRNYPYVEKIDAAVETDGLEGDMATGSPPATTDDGAGAGAANNNNVKQQEQQQQQQQNEQVSRDARDESSDEGASSSDADSSKVNGELMKSNWNPNESN